MNKLYGQSVANSRNATEEAKSISHIAGKLLSKSGLGRWRCNSSANDWARTLLHPKREAACA